MIIPKQLSLRSLLIIASASALPSSGSVPAPISSIRTRLLSYSFCAIKSRFSFAFFAQKIKYHSEVGKDGNFVAVIVVGSRICEALMSVRKLAGVL